MVLLEIHFPHGFWDITPHLVLHLCRELYWCWPVHSRWMYSVERYLGVLKSFVRNKNPEGSNAMGYMYEEALGFVIEHFRLYPITARGIWDIEEDKCDSGEKMEDVPREVEWHEEDLIEVHEHVIGHSTVTEPYLRAYEVKQRRFEARRHRRFQSFGTWIKEKIQKMVEDGEAPILDLVNLSKLPSTVVREYPSIWAYGNHYRVNDEVGESHIRNDSGVAAMIIQVCQCDRHLVEALLKYVYFVNDLRNPHWSVVVHKDPWSRHVTNITRGESLSAPGPVDATWRFPAEIALEGEAVLGVDVENIFAHEEWDDDDAAHEDVDYEDEEEQENDHPNGIRDDLHPHVVTAGLDNV